MATLRSFQNEIEEIHTRELSKQRAHGSVEKEKENKHPKGKAKDEEAPVAAVQPVPTGSALLEIEDHILVSCAHRHRLMLT